MNNKRKKIKKKNKKTKKYKLHGFALGTLHRARRAGSFIEQMALSGTSEWKRKSL
jgi:hypothetical protein